jgi:sugar phosphate isomerase/epimerase
MQFSNREHLIGFSTGAVALGDWKTGVARIREAGLVAIELSALRLSELAPLIDATNHIDLSGFTYVSLHLPSNYEPTKEQFVVELAEQAADRGWPLILHPDVINDWEAWSRLGSAICIENMDKRKSAGRNVAELDDIFARLPQATFCFDFGHARQLDPTMSQAARILARFSSRLQQIHFSDVDSTNHHLRLNGPALHAFARVRSIAVPPVPIILETPVIDRPMDDQLELARRFFSEKGQAVYA